MRLFDYVRRARLDADTAKMFASFDLSECVVVDAQPVVEWWDAQLETLEGMDALKAIARCTPPFGLCFVEYREAEAYILRDVCARMNGLFVWRDVEKEDGSFTVYGSAWFRDDTGATGCFPSMTSLEVAKDGTPDWDSYRITEWPEVQAVSDDEFQEKFGMSKYVAFHQPSTRAFIIALVTFRFMHARNVQIVEQHPTRQAIRLAERNKEPEPTRFYTLDIAPITKKLDDEGQLSTAGLAKALHICRGHFADYTKGAGLFGKYKVEVFVPEHFKGRAARGRVEKDYRVTPHNGA